MFFQVADGRLPCLSCAEAILPVNAVELELSLSCLPDAIHSSGFCRDDAGILSLVVRPQVDDAHYHS
jgi:hypothetical protein